MKKERVLMAMSGGLDSAMSAILLKEQGYELVGVTMDVWEQDNKHLPLKKKDAFFRAVNDARRLALELDIPHYVLNVRDFFKKNIVDYFIDEYLSGRTPNPCVKCNPLVKWGELLKFADDLDCQYIATGHYVQVRYENGRYVLSEGLDKVKDQSYFLWGLKQEQLARTIFPLGGLAKTEVRKMALRHGFDVFAKKGESFNVCFIPGEYRDFLKKHAGSEILGGEVCTPDGNCIKHHNGVPFFTVGQKIDENKNGALFVKRMDAEKNLIVADKKENVFCSSFRIDKINLIKYRTLPPNFECGVKIRYKDNVILCSVLEKDGSAIVKLSKPLFAAGPGQSALLLEGDDIVGGGIISEVF